jgi:hypothetical protein
MSALGKLDVQFSTIVGNEFEGIQTNGNGQVTMAHTIVAGNGGSDCSGTITSHGYNLIQKPSCTFAIQSTDLLNVDPMLGPLQNNGGPTLTHAPLPGSPVIDAGSSLSRVAPASDQRGTTRPLDGNRDGVVRYDIGAVEFAP